METLKDESLLRKVEPSKSPQTFLWIVRANSLIEKALSDFVTLQERRYP